MRAGRRADCVAAHFVVSLVVMNSEHELVVEEAIGPSIDAWSAAAAIYLGTLALLMVGVMPALLGALADAGRITNQDIGLCAMFESLMIGVSAGLCGAFLK